LVKASGLRWLGIMLLAEITWRACRRLGLKVELYTYFQLVPVEKLPIPTAFSLDAYRSGGGPQPTEFARFLTGR
jgi:hypothetical protein